MDALILSRIQFAVTSGFHYIYPPLSIGLGIFLVIIEGIYLKTKNPYIKEMTKFWVKIFALTFALGVATGLVQAFGFGTNWAPYSRFVGDVFGSALGAEGVFAFFLEAGFLGVMLFGWDRVRPKMHYLATILVCFGAHFSAVWIVIANSWMQTPAGYKIVGEGIEAKAVVTNFWEMAFNPSSIDRLVHVVLGCWLAGSFLILSISAYYLLRQKHLIFARLSMKVGLLLSGVTLVLQLISADSTAKGVAKNQPAKLAAMEGIYKTEEMAPITLFGWVDTKREKVIGPKIPGALSFLTHYDIHAPVTGLEAFPKEDRPNVQVVFQTYHIMIACWGAMAFLTLLAFLQLRRKRLEKSKLLLWGLVFSVFLPQIANQAGWMTAEIGRQPWIVYNLLRTVQGVSPNLTTTQVATSLIMFLVIYTLLFFLFIFLLNHKIKHGPDSPEEKRPEKDGEVYRDPFSLKPSKEL